MINGVPKQLLSMWMFDPIIAWCLPINWHAAIYLEHLHWLLSKITRDSLQLGTYNEAFLNTKRLQYNAAESVIVR